MIAIFLMLLVLAAPSQALEEIGDRLDAAVAAGEVQSAVAASWRGGERRHHYAGARTAASEASPPDAQTRYGIGSISKVFTNLLLAELVAAGRVEYSTPVGELLGDDFDPANPAIADITLEQLATHTSGLPRLPANLDTAVDPTDPYAHYDAEALRQGLTDARAQQRLGKGYAYSNFGAGLLGWLLGEVDGRGYPAALQAEVLRPLRLRDTGFDPGDNAADAFAGGETVPAWTFDALAGAGALWSSADDLLQLAEVLVGTRPDPLEHSVRADFEVIADAGSFQVTRVWHVAATPFGPVYWHNGGTAGHRTFFGVRPATGDALVVLVAGGFDPTGLALEWFRFERGTQEAADVDPAILGQYQLDEQVGIGVFAEGGPLRAQLSGQPAVPIEAIGDDWYRFNVADAALRFDRERDAVVAVELVQDGRIQRARKTGERASVLDRDASEIELDDGALDAFIGEFALNSRAKFTVRRGGESGLEVRLTGQPFFPVFPRGNDVFFYKVVEAELHFERDDDGAVVAVVLHQGGMQQRAERVR